MKKSIFVLSAIAILSLSSCGTPTSTSVSTGSTDAQVSAEAPVEVPAFETSQKETPATKFCVKNGGTVSFETKKEGEFSMDIAYCTVGGEKKDAWAYMSEVTTATGETEVVAQ